MPVCLRLSLWLVLLAFVAGCQPVSKAPQIVDGHLTLTLRDLDGTVALDGTWRARPDADHLAFAAFDFDDADWARVPVPSFFGGQGFPNEGLVTYRLHLHLPQDAPPLRGRVLQADNAHALYAARPGEPPLRIAASGRPAPSAEGTLRSRRPVVFDLPQDTALVLTWQVANHGYRQGGPLNSIHIGTADVVLRRLVAEVGLIFATFGLYLFLTLSFLFYWWRRRDDQQLLAVALLAGVMAVRTIVVAGIPDFLFPAAYSFELRIALEAGSYLALNGLFAWLLVTFFPRELAPLRIGRLVLRPPHEPDAFAQEAPAADVSARRQHINTAVVALAVVTSGLSTLLAFVAPPVVTSYVLGASFVLSLLLIGFAVSIVAGALRRRRPLARGMALGLGFLFLGGVHDILMATGLLPGHTYLTTYAFLVFLLVQSYAIARRHAYYARLAREKAEVLRHEVQQRTKELRATTIAAHAANLAKSQFVAAVSHELRTPLASILGYSQLLREDLEGRMGREEREFIGTIEASGQRLLSLVNDLLDIAKLEAGRLELRIGPVRADTIAGEVADALYPIALEKGLALRTDIAPSDVYVLADPDRLRQVLINLVSNAVKFTQAGEVVLRVRPARLGARAALAFAVHDTGPGISPEFLPRLFDRFSQDPDAYKQTQRGTGLGLTISRELTLKMDGTIDVDTRLGAGSTFTVTFPRTTADVEPGVTASDPGRPQPHTS